MKLLLKSAFLLAMGLLVYTAPAQAQVQIQVGINQPHWGPPVPQGVQYYYIPEIDGYYDLYSQSYLFFDPVYGAWVSSPVLPRAYAAYDPRFFHPVVIQYVGRQPWGYLRDHRAYCNNWGVQPGRYYGANWPGRGYSYAVPRGGYYGGNNGYYNRSNNPGGYARGDYRDDNRGGYYGGSRNQNRGSYDNRGSYGSNDNRGGGYNPRNNNDNRSGGYDNRSSNDNRGGGFDRNENRGSNDSRTIPNQSNSGGRGRGRIN